MKNKLLYLLTIVAFFSTISFGHNLYRNYIPPYQENTCIEFDARYLYEEEPGPNTVPTIVFGQILKNDTRKGLSSVVLIYEIMPDVYVSQMDSLYFVELRDVKAKEVSCD